jgi:hypothetical protein
MRIVFSVILTMSGCLSIVPGMRSHSISFDGGQDGVKVELLGDGKVLHEGTSPARFRVSIAKGLIVRFSKPGYYTETLYLRTKPSVSRGGLSLLLSIGSFFIGLFVDSQTGVLQEFEKETFSVTLTPTGATASSKPLDLRIVRDNDVVIVTPANP